MASKSVVIVDRSGSSGVGLRSRLLGSGDSAHVFSHFDSALKMVQHKKIDAVLVEFDTDKETTAFCDAVRALSIPIVYASLPVQPFDPRQYGFVAAFPELPHSPRLAVQYMHR